MSMEQMVGIILHKLETIKNFIVAQQFIVQPMNKYSSKDSVKLSNFIKEKLTTTAIV
jgi:ribosomal 50S subunit-associated protein YjgA (DUF615 family)